MDDLSEFVRALSARAALRRVAVLLGAARIAVMPLKGVLLQSGLYGVRWHRAMTDVDVLVREDDYLRAMTVLAQAGCTCTHNTSTEAYVHVPGHTWVVDLHRRLLLRDTFGLDTAGVFCRAHADARLFGTEVWLPDPLDLYAHLLGHFLSSRTRLEDSERLADFADVARVHTLDPARVALHLHAQGLARAARYVLPLVLDRAGDAFAGAVLGALPFDPLGDVLASGLRQVLPRVGPRVGYGMLGTHALGRTLPSGVVGCSRRVIDRCLREVVRRKSRKTFAAARGSSAPAREVDSRARHAS